MMRAGRQWDLSYNILAGNAVLRCHECDAVGEQHIALGHNPEAIIKRFRRVGWEADLHTKRLCICPRCIMAKGAARAALKKEKHDMVNGHLRSVSVPHSETTGMTGGPLMMEKPPVIPQTAATTAAQRLKIRQLLDANFDDAKGRYIAGASGPFSDEKVATAAGVAPGAVKIIREMAYGPLLGDDDLDEMRADLDSLKATQAKMQAAVDAYERRFGETLRRLGIA